MGLGIKTCRARELRQIIDEERGPDDKHKGKQNVGQLRRGWNGGRGRRFGLAQRRPWAPPQPSAAAQDDPEGQSAEGSYLRPDTLA